MKTTSIGFIGLGNVGKKLANNLINKKNKIFLYDKNPKTYFYFKNKNVFLCKSFKDLVINSNIIITCLPSPVVVNNVINSLIPHISISHLSIEMSTSDRDEMIRLSTIFK